MEVISCKWRVCGAIFMKALGESAACPDPANPQLRKNPNTEQLPGGGLIALRRASIRD